MPDANDHFLTPDNDIVIDASVSGIESSSQFEMHVSLCNVAGEVLEQKLWKLDSTDKEVSLNDIGYHEIGWKIAARQHGCYFVRAVLKRDQQTVQSTETTLVISEPVQSRPTGEFGWSLDTGLGPLRRRRSCSRCLRSWDSLVEKFRSGAQCMRSTEPTPPK